MLIRAEFIARVFLDAGHKPGTHPSPEVIHAACNAIADECMAACQEIASRYPLGVSFRAGAPGALDPQVERSRMARTVAENCARAIAARLGYDEDE